MMKNAILYPESTLQVVRNGILTPESILQMVQSRILVPETISQVVRSRILTPESILHPVLVLGMIPDSILQEIKCREVLPSCLLASHIAIIPPQSNTLSPSGPLSPRPAARFSLPGNLRCGEHGAWREQDLARDTSSTNTTIRWFPRESASRVPSPLSWSDGTVCAFKLPQ